MIALLLGSSLLGARDFAGTVRPTLLPAFLDALPADGDGTFVNARASVDVNLRMKSPDLAVGDVSGAIPGDAGLRFLGTMAERPLGRRELFDFGRNEYRLYEGGFGRTATVNSVRELQGYQLAATPPAGDGKLFLAMYARIAAALGPPSLVGGTEHPARTVRIQDWRALGAEREPNDPTLADLYIREGVNSRCFVWAWGAGGPGDLKLPLNPPSNPGETGPTFVLRLQYATPSAFRGLPGRADERTPTKIELRIEPAFLD